MLRFKPRPPLLLGIDIGTTTVKFVELSRCGGGCRVDAAAIEPLPAGAVAAGGIADAEAVGETIRRAAKHRRSRRKAASVAVHSSVVMVKTVLIDSVLARDAVAVAVEAERHIPYAIDDVALDFAALGPFPDDPALTQVRLAVCPKEYVDGREAALAFAGLRAAVVELETHALQRAAARLCAADATVGVFDIGAAKATFVAVEGGAENGDAFIREESFDGASFGDDYAALADAALDAMERLCDGYLALRDKARMDRLLLAGAPARAPNLAALASMRLGAPASVATPFAGLEVGKHVSATMLERDAPSLMGACGLALRVAP